MSIINAIKFSNLVISLKKLEEGILNNYPNTEIKLPTYFGKFKKEYGYHYNFLKTRKYFLKHISDVKNYIKSISEIKNSSPYNLKKDIKSLEINGVFDVDNAHKYNQLIMLIDDFDFYISSIEEKINAVKEADLIEKEFEWQKFTEEKIEKVLSNQQKIITFLIFISIFIFAIIAIDFILSPQFSAFISTIKNNAIKLERTFGIIIIVYGIGMALWTRTYYFKTNNTKSKYQLIIRGASLIIIGLILLLMSFGILK